MNEKKNFVEEISEKDLNMIVGAKKGRGWLATVTDDCPNSVFVCC